MVEAPSVRCTQRPELGTSMPSGVVHRIRFHPLAHLLKVGEGLLEAIRAELERRGIRLIVLP